MVLDTVRDAWPTTEVILEHELPNRDAQLLVGWYDRTFGSDTSKTIKLSVQQASGEAVYRFAPTRHGYGRLLRKHIDATVPAEQFTSPDAGANPISTAYQNKNAVLGYNFMETYPLRPSNNVDVGVSALDIDESEKGIDIDLTLTYTEQSGYRTDPPTVFETLEAETSIPVEEHVNTMIDSPDAYRRPQ